MKGNILILGKGFIGARLAETFGCNISDRRIHSLTDVQAEIEKYQPEVIINCTGYGGKTNIDQCEQDKEKTLEANTFIPVLLAEAAVRNKIKLVHVSSGCIFHFNYSKDKPIVEDKEPDFFDLFYSRTKIYAEQILQAASKKANILIVRIRIPLDNRPHPKNILTKLIKYKKVINLANSLTYIPDFITALKHLLAIDVQGIYHLVNKGGLCYPQLLDIYKKYVSDFEYQVIDYSQLNLVRTNLILSAEKLEKSGFKTKEIGAVLENCVREYVAAQDTFCGKSRKILTKRKVKNEP